MMTIPLVPRHLAEVELGAEEREQSTLFGFDMFDALEKWDGPAWSLVGNGDRVVGCFGMLVAGGNGILWAVLSDEARANRYGLHRAARRHLQQAECLIPDGCILAAIRHGYEPGRQWIRHLGFTYDCDLSVGNERYERHVRWPHQHR